ncbi:MAG: hypothetical protein GVY15_00145 [Bacteroidetes bacterium]|jgi:hypothetical protein|nr:hypothetical protein [Bacteroidota bacterium]
MNKSISICVIFFSLLLSACGEKEIETEEDFFARTPQELTERVVSTHISMIDSVDIFTAYDLGSMFTFTAMGDTLYIPAGADVGVVRASGKEPTVYDVLPLRRGEGPGEVENTQDMDRKGSRLVVSDTRQGKIVVLQTDGTVEKEIRTNELSPHKISLFDPNQAVILSPISHDNVLHVISIEEGYRRSFGPSGTPHNPLRYAGQIQSDGKHIFYAGLSEPILKKYTIDGELIYSRATIDNYDTGGNYITSEDSEYAMFRYTDWAVYSAYQFALTDRYLVINPVPSEDFPDTHQILDLYHKEDGEYSHSIGLDRNLRGVAVGEDYLYGRYITEDRAYYLVRYPNIFSGSDEAYARE